MSMVAYTATIDRFTPFKGQIWKKKKLLIEIDLKYPNLGPWNQSTLKNTSATVLETCTILYIQEIIWNGVNHNCFRRFDSYNQVIFSWLYFLIINFLVSFLQPSLKMRLSGTWGQTPVVQTSQEGCCGFPNSLTLAGRCLSVWSVSRKCPPSIIAMDLPRCINGVITVCLIVNAVISIKKSSECVSVCMCWRWRGVFVN